MGEGTYGHYRGHVGQQGAMHGQHGGYSYDPNWVPPSPTPLLSIKQILIEQERLPLPPYPQRPFHAPHTYFMPFEYNQPSQSIVDQDSSSSHQEQSESDHGYGIATQQYGAYLFNQYRRNDDDNDDDDIKPGRHSTWN